MNNENSKVDVVKQFNVNEYSSWLLSKGSPHNCIIVAGINGDIDVSLFKKIICQISKKHENLQYSITLDRCGFISTNQPLPVYEIISNNGWQEIGENELKKPFLSGEVLARITLLKTKEIQYIIFCYHHIIGDGASGIQFLLDVVSRYNTDSIIEPAEMIDQFKDPIDLWPTPRSQSFLKPKIERTTKIYSIKFGGLIVDKLLKHVKETGYTLNSYLSALILSSTYEVFNIESIQVHLPIDLRKTHPFPLNKLKFYTSWIDFPVKIFHEFTINNICKIIRNEIKNSLKNNQHINNLEKLLYTINTRENDETYLTKFISHKPMIAISYSGNIQFANESNNLLKLTEIHMSVNSQSYMGTPESFTIQTTLLNNESLFINLNYPYPLVLEENIKKFSDALSKKITSVR